MAPPPVPLRVESVELQNVGPFKALEIEFPPAPVAGLAEVHILTGINGAGKSTLLHAIAGCLAPAARAALEKRFRMLPARAVVKINGDRQVCGNFEFKISEETNDELVVDLKRDLAGGIGLSKAIAVYYSGARQIPESIVATGGKANSNPSHGALNTSAEIDHRALLNWIFENRVRAALAEADNASSELLGYERNINLVCKILAEITELQFQFDIDRSTFAVRVRLRGESIPLDVLPDGLKSVVAWVGDLMRRLEQIEILTGTPAQDIPLLLLLDEIDIHLHPRWQRRILPAVQQAFPKAQIILTTHSPFVVGSVEHAWVYRLDPAHTTCTARPSRAGDSLETILEEVFGVPEIFDVHTHRLFEQFYAEKRKVLTQGAPTPALQELAETLSARGDEVQDIVSRELAQLRRIQQQAQARVAD